MKSQFIEVKVVVEIMTDEEISYVSAEQLVVDEVKKALELGFRDKTQPSFSIQDIIT